MATKHSCVVPERFYVVTIDSYAVPGLFCAVRNHICAATKRSDVALGRSYMPTKHFCGVRCDASGRELRRRPLRTDVVTFPERDRPPLSPHFTAH